MGALTMEEGIKNRVILILVILTVILFIGALNSCSSAQRYRAAHDKEMAARLNLEEKMNKITQEKRTWDEKLEGKDKELEEGKAALETAQQNLEGEVLLRQSLEEELEKVIKLKETLEEDLKDLLVTGRRSKSDR